MDNDVLRAVLTFDDGNAKTHFLFLQKYEEDKLYLVS